MHLQCPVLFKLSARGLDYIQKRAFDVFTDHKCFGRIGWLAFCVSLDTSVDFQHSDCYMRTLSVIIQLIIIFILSDTWILEFTYFIWEALQVTYFPFRTDCFGNTEWHWIENLSRFFCQIKTVSPIWIREVFALHLLSAYSFILFLTCLSFVWTVVSISFSGSDLRKFCFNLVVEHGRNPVVPCNSAKT